MPWQQHVADVALEINPETGRLAYRRVVLTVPRQSGKTTLMLSLLLTRALGWGSAQRIVYTAQNGVDARDKWHDDWLPVIGKSPYQKHLKGGKPRLTNGHEALVFTNGSIQILAGSTKKEGHGKTLDLAIVDEAFSQPDSRVEQSFAMPMITRPEPQIWIVSTAGEPGFSPYLWEKVELGRQLAEVGSTDGVAYFEWSAPEDADPDDPATWWACMPALGFTVTEDAVRTERSGMSLPDFRRGFLNQWVTGKVDPVISADQWAACADPGADAQDGGRVCFAVDVSPDRSQASICVAGGEGFPVVHRVDSRPGTGWVVDRLAELREKHRPYAILLDAGSAAGSLIPDLGRAGIVEQREPDGKFRHGSLILIGAREYGQACGLFFDAVVQGRLRHRGQADVVAAVDGAVKRKMGDAWAWDRHNASVDITSVVGMTLALWGHLQHRPPRPKVRVVNLAAALEAA